MINIEQNSKQETVKKKKKAGRGIAWRNEQLILQLENMIRL